MMSIRGKRILWMAVFALAVIPAFEPVACAQSAGIDSALLAKAGGGDAGSQVLLGDAYAAGKGVAQDLKQAAEWYRKAISKPGHDLGMQGSMSSASPCKRNPRSHSRPARYIHPAEPVYQVHPPRPTWGGVE